MKNILTKGELLVKYEKHHRLIHWINNRVAKRYHIDPKETHSTAILAFINAMRPGYYDENKGKLSTYLYKAIAREIMFFMRRDRNYWSLILRSKEEIVFNIEANSSFEQEYFMYRIPDEDPTWCAAFIELFEGDSDKLFDSLTKDLNKREKEIIIGRFKIGNTFDELAQVYGITRERVRQIQEASLEIIRKKVFVLESVARLFDLFDFKPDNYKQTIDKVHRNRKVKTRGPYHDFVGGTTEENKNLQIPTPRPVRGRPKTSTKNLSGGLPSGPPRPQGQIDSRGNIQNDQQHVPISNDANPTPKID